jgi:hypothetical protein
MNILGGIKQMKITKTSIRKPSDESELSFAIESTKASTPNKKEEINIFLERIVISPHTRSVLSFI